jgi:hypothetical protein
MFTLAFAFGRRPKQRPEGLIDFLSSRQGSVFKTVMINNKKNNKKGLIELFFLKKRQRS